MSKVVKPVKKGIKKGNHLTEVLNAINTKEPCKYNRKEVSAWIISLFLSEDPQLIEIVNKINQYHFTLDDELIFKYYVSTVPKKRRYIKFTKKTKETKELDKEVEYLMKTYDVSRREALLSLKGKV